MVNYKLLTAIQIVKNDITNPDDITGLVIYNYLDIVENKTMANYYAEAKKYCYKLIDGSIGILPMQTIDRITDEVIKLTKIRKNN